MARFPADGRNRIRQPIPVLQSEIGWLRPICTETGLARLSWQEAAFAEDLPDLNPDVSRETVSQLDSYLRGNRQDFTLPLDLSAVTRVARRWLDCLAHIPYGQVISYADLAEKWGNRRAARPAGQACRRNPLPIILPCHRVVSSTGGLTQYSGGSDRGARDPANLQRKIWLQQLEARNTRSVAAAS